MTRMTITIGCSREGRARRKTSTLLLRKKVWSQNPVASCHQLYSSAKVSRRYLRVQCHRWFQLLIRPLVNLKIRKMSVSPHIPCGTWASRHWLRDTKYVNSKASCSTSKRPTHGLWTKKIARQYKRQSICLSVPVACRELLQPHLKWCKTWTLIYHRRKRSTIRSIGIVLIMLAITQQKWRDLSRLPCSIQLNWLMIIGQVKKLS